MKAALIISHGSHSPKTKIEVQALVASLRKVSPIPIWEYAFLEIESPNIPDGIKLCVEQGAHEITILLNFLNSGKHVDMDIPAIVGMEGKKYPQVKLKISPPVGQHPHITQLFMDILNAS